MTSYLYVPVVKEYARMAKDGWTNDCSLLNLRSLDWPLSLVVL